MNIAYLLTHSLETGGAQKDIFAFTGEFTRRGHKVVVICRDKERGDRVVSLGARYHEVNFHFRSIPALAQSARHLRQILIDEKIDVIAPQSIRTALAAYFANRGLKKPIVTTIHNIHSWFNSFFSGLILNFTGTFIVFESDYERRRMVRLGLSRVKTVTVHSGIDLERFKPRSKDIGLLESLGLKANTPVLGTVARLSPEKGQNHIISAMSRVAAEVPDAVFLFIGDGPLRQELSNRVKSSGLEKNIRFLGEQKEIPRYLSILDVFVLASTRESFPLSAREAMAQGRPVIATRVGGCPEVVSDKVTGLLLPPARPELLAESMILLLKDRTLREKMQVAGREKALELFDERKWLNANEEILSYFGRNPDKKVPGGLLRKFISSVVYYFLCVFSRPKGIRILMYHKVTDYSPFDRLSVRVHDFRKQMEYLKKHCEVISLEKLPDDRRWTIDDRQKKQKVVITFDDGYMDNYTNAYPILKELGLPATIFLTVDSMDKPGFLTLAQLHEMAGSKVSFGAHTLSHALLSEINKNSAMKEITGSKEKIQSWGFCCQHFCYPKGRFNDDVKRMVRDAGFDTACSVKPGANFSGADLFELRRTEISGFDGLFDFEKKLAGAYDMLHALAQKKR